MINLTNLKKLQMPCEGSRKMWMCAALHRHVTEFPIIAENSQLLPLKQQQENYQPQESQPEICLQHAALILVDLIGVTSLLQQLTASVEEIGFSF